MGVYAIRSIASIGEIESYKREYLVPYYRHNCTYLPIVDFESFHYTLFPASRKFCVAAVREAVEGASLSGTHFALQR